MVLAEVGTAECLVMHLGVLLFILFIALLCVYVFVCKITQKVMDGLCCCLSAISNADEQMQALSASISVSRY